ncbi:MAG: OmpA family protein [Halobacteriovoraceae bacterium]|jgi:chemotaxis protein MotB|nr:OmpA family protein [Halobacteriovoraceae bacterium]
MADEKGVEEECEDCEVCIPGLPGWMATFSDMVTLLLTFFVLLLSFAKTESAKYEAALGSIRNAFGGNVLKQGPVLQPGKSPDNSPTMLDSAEPIKPFPIEFLTMEGILDKHEVNRESEEDLTVMRSDLKQFDLQENVEIQQMPEGIKVRIKDKIYFNKGSIKSAGITVEVYKKMVNMLSKKDWTVFVVGHASRGEVSGDKSKDAFALSASRAMAVSRSLIRRGVRSDKVSTVFYGDTRPEKVIGDMANKTQAELEKANRRVEFIFRKTDLSTNGAKVQPYE